MLLHSWLKCCPPTPTPSIALQAGVCERKRFSHDKTLQVTLLGTCCSGQANSNRPAPVPFGSQHRLLPCSRTERRHPMGCCVVLCRPGCRDKVLLQLQCRGKVPTRLPQLWQSLQSTQGKAWLGVCAGRMDGVPLLFRYWISSLLNSSL